jgi:hypothetical protein
MEVRCLNSSAHNKKPSSRKNGRILYGDVHHVNTGSQSTGTTMTKFVVLVLDAQYIPIYIRWWIVTARDAKVRLD